MEWCSARNDAIITITLPDYCTFLGCLSTERILAPRPVMLHLATADSLLKIAVTMRCDTSQLSCLLM